MELGKDKIGLLIAGPDEVLNKEQLIAGAQAAIAINGEVGLGLPSNIPPPSNFPPFEESWTSPDGEMVMYVGICPHKLLEFLNAHA